MSFNFPWTNRKNNQDYVFAEDVNALAGGIRMAGSHAENVLAAHKQSADHDVRYYTKQQSCDRFANALIGSTIGSTIALTDIQPGATEARELTIYGKTVETGTGDKSPDNPYTLTGAGESGSVPIVVSDGTNSQTVDVPVSAPLYSLPNGVRDEVDVTGGRVIRRVGKAVIDGNAKVTKMSQTETYAGIRASFYARIGDSAIANMRRPQTSFIHVDWVISSSHPLHPSYNAIDALGVSDRYMLAIFRAASSSDFAFNIPVASMPGYDVSLTDAQKESLATSWLSSNPITVLYELAEPVIETILPIDIPLYSPDCTITTTDEAEPELHVAYNRDLNATLQALQDAIETITGG